MIFIHRPGQSRFAVPVHVKARRWLAGAARAMARDGIPAAAIVPALGISRERCRAAIEGRAPDMNDFRRQVARAARELEREGVLA